MRKFLMGLVLAAAFVVSLPGTAKAQYYTPGPCNQTATSNGLTGQSGVGPNGAFALRVRIEAKNYTASGGNQVVTDAMVQDIVDVLNQSAVDANDQIRFSASDFNAPEAQRNLSLYFEIYANSDGTYNVFLTVNGLGDQHLFNVEQSDTKDIGGATVVLVTRAENLLQHGWTCGPND